MEQCLNPSRGKICKKEFGDPNLGQIGHKFFVISSSVVVYFTLKLHRMITWNIVQRSKTHEKNFGGGPKLGLKLGFLPFSQVCIISFPCYCTRLQLGTMSNMKIKKTSVAQIGTEMIFLL